VEAIKLSVQLGADKEAKTVDDGATPLFVATGHGQVEAIKLLVQLGVDKEAKNRCLSGQRRVRCCRTCTPPCVRATAAGLALVCSTQSKAS
jgi:hypothetical protein